MNINNFYKCPLCLENIYKINKIPYSNEYISCDDCIRKIIDPNLTTGDIALNISRYILNVIHDDFFSIKIEKYDDQVISIDLEKYVPNIKLSIMDIKTFSTIRSIKIPFDKKILSSNDLIRFINKIESYRFLI